MKKYLLAAVAALAIGGSVHVAAQVQPLVDAKPADAPVDFTFSLECQAVEGLPNKRIVPSYEMAVADWNRESARTTNDKQAKEFRSWQDKAGIEGVWDRVVVAYNHGLPEYNSIADEFEAHVTEVTPNTIRVGNGDGMITGHFDRRTRYGEIIEYQAGEQPVPTSKVEKMWMFQCEPSKPAKF
jgi:hypothetical protein